MSTFNRCPKYANNIAKIAFPKNPDKKTPISNFLFNDETIPPKTVSNAATIANA